MTGYAVPAEEADVGSCGLLPVLETGPGTAKSKARDKSMGV